MLLFNIAYKNYLCPDNECYSFSSGHCSIESFIPDLQFLDIQANWQKNWPIKLFKVIIRKGFSNEN